MKTSGSGLRQLQRIPSQWNPGLIQPPKARMILNLYLLVGKKKTRKLTELEARLGQRLRSSQPHSKSTLSRL